MIRAITTLFIFLNISIFATSSGYAGDFLLVSEDDTIRYSVSEDAHYEYPNVILVVKREYKLTGKKYLDAVFVLCDQWQLASVPAQDIIKHKNDPEKLKNMEVQGKDFQKDTVAAALFTVFCSELHRRTPYAK